VDVFAALADPTRRHILDLLCERERSAGELAAAFTISRPAVSKHLRVLRESGLADVREDAQRRIYRVNPAPLAEADAWLARYRRFWESKLDELARRLEQDQRP
jgi:DNA-binding transcriptional ArsR family regulator